MLKKLKHTPCPFMRRDNNNFRDNSGVKFKTERVLKVGSKKWEMCLKSPQKWTLPLNPILYEKGENVKLRDKSWQTYIFLVEILLKNSPFAP